jgi:hypothetical protein
MDRMGLAENGQWAHKSRIGGQTQVTHLLRQDGILGYSLKERFHLVLVMIVKVNSMVLRLRLMVEKVGAGLEVIIFRITSIVFLTVLVVRQKYLQLGSGLPQRFKKSALMILEIRLGEF